MESREEDEEEEELEEMDDLEFEWRRGRGDSSPAGY